MQISISHSPSFYLRRSRGLGINVALLQALINAQRNVGRNIRPEGLDILAIQALRESERGAHNVLVQAKEVGSNGRGARVLAVQASNKGGRHAVLIDLVVDGAHGEDGALEFVKGAGDLGLVARLHEAVFENVAEGHFALDDGEEFGGARVDVGAVHAAGFDEADRGRDTKAREDGKRLDISRLRGSALSASIRLRVIEVEDGEGLELLSVKQLLALVGEQALEALDGRGSREQLLDQLGVVGRRWRRRRGRRRARGCCDFRHYGRRGGGLAVVVVGALDVDGVFIPYEGFGVYD